MSQRSVVFSFLILGLAAATATATRTPEEDSKHAYEQIEGKAIGTGVTAMPRAGVKAEYGIKAPPMTASPPKHAMPVARSVPAPGSRSPERGTSPLGRLADQGMNGIVISALVGLVIGGGFGLLTGHDRDHR